MNARIHPRYGLLSAVLDGEMNREVSLHIYPITYLGNMAASPLLQESIRPYYWSWSTNWDPLFWLPRSRSKHFFLGNVAANVDIRLGPLDDTETE